MKKLTNKKGFTLIEMLVVIAIIAILVAIIIPVVQSSTTKAAAAADAANMRSYKAEIATAFLSKETTGTGANVTQKVTVADNGNVTVAGIDEPTMKDVGTVITTTGENAADFTVTSDGSEFTVRFGGKSIAWFALVAENGDTGVADPNPVTAG